MQKLTSFIVLLALLSSSALAEIQYVSDEMYVPMRSGPGNEFRIIHSRIRSGLKMTVLDPGQESEWVQVKTPAGLEGWIRKQYLKKQPTAKLLLSAAIGAENTAKEKVTQLEQQLAELKTLHSSLSQESSELETNHAKVSEELGDLKTLSANAISLNYRYKELLAKHDLIQTEFDAVRAENDRLNGDKTINQWMVGAGLIIFGMILMLILPALKTNKRNSEWRD